MLLIGYKNTVEQAVPALGLIDFGDIYHAYGLTNRFGSAVFTSNGTIQTLSCRGFYHITATVTYTAPAAGDATFQLIEDNTPVDGILVTQTVTTADTETNTAVLDFYVLVRGTCPKTITIRNTGVAVDITNAILNITKEV